MITWEKLQQVNEKMGTVDIEKKDKRGNVSVTKYAMVKDRISAFRELCPTGSIVTEVLSLANGTVTIKATVSDEDGQVLGTGIAQEKEGNGFINANSAVENCESSAIGRALGTCGFGIGGSMASAEEVANAIKNQGAPQKETPVTENEKHCLSALAEIIGEDLTTILDKAGWTPGGRLTRGQFTKALNIIGEELKRIDKEE